MKIGAQMSWSQATRLTTIRIAVPGNRAFKIPYHRTKSGVMTILVAASSTVRRKLHSSTTKSVCCGYGHG
jgi:hypothetical protein